MTSDPNANSGENNPEREFDGEEPVVRDKRRINPETGELREPAAAGPEPAADAGLDVPDDISSLDDTPAPAEGTEIEDENAKLAADRLDDLQRLQAEFVNYKKRVDRDRPLAQEAGVTSVANVLMPVLDEVELARQHGDLTGPFEAHATKLYAALEKVGITQFGAKGEEFDPTVHEALMQHTDAEVETDTVDQVLQPGYKVGERVLRAARVSVAQPE
ncbi:nucleotide exchange factor GrpE [Spelaeicoccus albus]|uniref:Protein GrpE n=1 Tax=Spelaeicoccus albus TaxID=1280376 RepID=A0A7Z0AAQ2_9MICO|nr:nucleotide exchange factor GrpE [Spelaeicoccus albus]NYI66193.1 molecular chaperone GrpE [Spelaeicoccus albus]